jgi:hypothetical protein
VRGLNISLRSQACTNTYTGEMYSHTHRAEWRAAARLCVRSHAESLAMRFNFIPHYLAFVFAEGVPLTPLNGIVV